MAICPLCNGLKELKRYCANCGTLLADVGKVSDYFDPYGHYNDEETVKMGDGYPNTAQDQVCPHLMSCKNCNHDEVLLIQEQ